ncbi:BTAD domain-containing putative transcriptional regulator [Streptomyces sp. NPDC054796]
MRYRYRVLGSTRALREDGTAVPLGGARLRALLAALALAGGRTVRVSALIAEVWSDGEDAPADEIGALQALVGRLRRALGRDHVASGDGGYRLVAARDDIDLFRFEDLADEGARALKDGDPEKCAALLDDALALWSGPPLADLPDGGGAAGVRAEALHLAARRTRLEAALALGHTDSALPTLRQLAAGHPLDEPLQALLLRALRDAGRPAEALAAYEEVRTTLADRLGTDPGPGLRALHEELLSGGERRQPPKATGTPGPSPGTGPAPAPAPAPAPGPATSPGPAPGTGPVTPAPGTGSAPGAASAPGSGPVPGTAPTSGTAPAPGAGHETGPVPESGPAPGAGAESAPAPGAGAASAPGSGPVPGTAPTSGTAPEPGAGHETGPVPESGPAPGAGAESAPASAHAPEPGTGVESAPTPAHAPAPGAGHETGPVPGPGPAPGAGAESAPAPGTGAESAPAPASAHAPEPGTGAESAPTPASGSRSGAGAASVSASEAGPASGAGPVTGTGPAAAPGPVAPPGSVPGAGPGPAPGAGPRTGPAPAPGAGPGPGPVPGAGSASGAPFAPVPGVFAGSGAHGVGHLGPARPGNLRARLTSFVGRDAEIRALRDDLAGARLVTLTGPGGAGKTRLSLEAAEAAASSTEPAGPAAPEGGPWPDGVWVAELAPVRDPAYLAEAVLTALGGRETVLRGSTAEELRAAADPHALDPLAQLAERCAARRMLLVLDNCEHVIDAAATLVERLLTDCPWVTVLATSREPLGVPGESVRTVEPLPDPFALQLLDDRGASARPGFRTADDPEACAEICRRLDGLPLAIELAAARLRSLTPRQLADRLDDRFRLLTSGSRTVLPRQQTLRAVVDWSWGLLEDGERAVLRRLSVFSGGCELEQAEEVCGDPDPAHPGLAHPGLAHPGPDPATGVPAPVPPRDVTALLGSLVDKSLVVASPVPSDGGGPSGRMRYRLLETVAEYAGERLDEVPGERAAAERRHLVAYRELARTAEPLLHGPDQGSHLERLEREHDNIRTALRRAVAARDEHEALCLVLSMSWFWQVRDHRVEARTWAETVMGLGPDPFGGPVTAKAPSLMERCTDAPPPMREELFQEARRGVALMALSEKQESVIWSESPEWQAHFRRVRETYTPGQPQTCRLPGMMWIFAWLLDGEADRFHGMLAATVEGCRRYGYDWELAFVLQLRAKLTGEHPGAVLQAARDTEESLEIFRRLGDTWGAAEALAGRAESHCMRGEFAAAAEDYRRAIEHAEALGALSQMPVLRARLGSALTETGDPDAVAEGDELLARAVDELERASGGEVPNFAAVQHAVRLGRTGETARARALVSAMEGQFRDRAPDLFCGIAQGLLAWLFVLDGEYAPALSKADEAIGRVSTRLGNLVSPNFLLHEVVTAAHALAELGDPELAATLLAVNDAHSVHPEGYQPQPVEVESRRSAETAVRAVFAARSADGHAAGAGAGADEAYVHAYARGGGLSIEEATALVSRAARERGAGRPGPRA